MDLSYQIDYTLLMGTTTAAVAGLVMREYPSSSSDSTHKARFDPRTGKATCTCRGSRSPKGCWHMAEVTAEGTSTAAPVTPAAPVAPTLTAVLPAAPVRPMLASAMTTTTFDDYVGLAGWVLEEKLDGHRVTTRVSASGVHAWSRPKSGKPALVRTLPPAIAAAMTSLPYGVYDGELMTSSTVIHAARRHGDAYVIFDVLELLGTSTLADPYSTRRTYLEMALAHYTASAPVLLIPASVPVTDEALAAILAAGGEGAILKRTAAKYSPDRRSPDWVKVKRKGAVTLTISGFKAGKSGPHSTTLLSDARGVEVAKCKTLTAALRAAMDADDTKFLGRRLVVAYTEKTDDGKYRHAMWDHFAGKGE